MKSTESCISCLTVEVGSKFSSVALKGLDDKSLGQIPYKALSAARRLKGSWVRTPGVKQRLYGFEEEYKLDQANSFLEKAILRDSKILNRAHDEDSKEERKNVDTVLILPSERDQMMAATFDFPSLSFEDSDESSNWNWNTLLRPNFLDGWYQTLQSYIVSLRNTRDSRRITVTSISINAIMLQMLII
ncbi:Icarapin [Apis cerana cerana]|uniref:Icarapin n=1 Tax=Apis cerana cerana TaxID=94128 RepID=A0A2A3EJ66_APICC|nr:Icarapin [Apis cerana cerana]